jgi:D-glycero-D-manno-heptose 1,7-bisphosphate phosphatase
VVDPIYQGDKVSKILLIDRDGVINQRAGKGHYITDPDRFILIEDTITTLAMLAEEKFEFIIISNQAGVGKGIFSAQQLDLVTQKMLSLLAEKDIPILDVFYCMHDYDDGCACRKPRPGMILAAAQKHDIDLNQCLFIGDDPRDVLTAQNACIGSVLINCSQNELSESGVNPDFYAPLLSLLLPKIRTFYAN